MEPKRPSEHVNSIEILSGDFRIFIFSMLSPFNVYEEKVSELSQNYTAKFFNRKVVLGDLLPVSKKGSSLIMSPSIFLRAYSQRFQKYRHFLLARQSPPLTITRYSKALPKKPCRAYHKASVTSGMRSIATSVVYRHPERSCSPMRATTRSLHDQIWPGVVSDFAPFEGTGAGTTAQETPEITFSEKARIA